MKRHIIVPLILLFSVGALLGESGERKLPYQRPFLGIGRKTGEIPAIIALKSYDQSLSNFYPLGRYRDFSLVNFGTLSQLNLEILGFEPLRVSASFGVSQNVTTTNRMKSITDIYLAIGAGWTFNFDGILPFKGLSFTPGINYGYLPHLVYGDYYVTGKDDFYAFSDQFLSVQMEVAYNLTQYLDDFELELFFSPSYMWFTEKEYQGHEIGFNLGVRFPLKELQNRKIKEQTAPLPMKPAPMVAEVPEPEPEPADTVAPKPGEDHGIAVTAGDPGVTTLTVQWPAAVDNVTAADNIRYTLYFSSAGPLETFEDIAERGNEYGTQTGHEESALLEKLTPDTSYFVTVVASDEAGNRFLYEQAEETTLSPFDGTGIAPGNFAIEVDLEKVIKIPIALNLDPATVNPDTVTVEDGVRRLPGQVQWDDNDGTIVFSPDQPYREGTEHVLRLSPEITDEDGNSIGTDYEFVFSTLKYDDIFAHWKFNQNYDDSSGNDHTATPKAWRSDDLPRFEQLDEMNSALHFYGGYNWGNYVDLGTIDMGQEFSITGWVYIETPPEDYSRKIMTFISNGNAGAVKDGFKVFFNNWNNDDRRIVIETGNGSQNRNSQTQEDFIAYNNWYHIAVVIDRPAGNVKLYFNGEQAETTAGGAILNDFNVNAPLHMAQFKDGYFHFSGYIDDLRIYKKNLSAEQISIIARTR